MFKKLALVLGCVTSMWLAAPVAYAAADNSAASAINQVGRLRAASQRAVKAYTQGLLKVAPEVSAASLAVAKQVIRANSEEALRVAGAGALKPLAQAVDRDAKALLAALDANPNAPDLKNLNATADRLLESADRMVSAMEAQTGSSNARVVNIAGRQRMLVQRMAKLYALEVVAPSGAAKQIEALRTEFKTNLDTLANAPISTPRIKSEIELARSQWVFFENALAGSSSGATALRDVAVSSDRIFDVMNELTAQYEAALKSILGQIGSAASAVAGARAQLTS